MIEAPVLEPPRHDLADDPGPPMDLQPLARQHDADADRGHRRDDGQEYGCRLPQRRSISFLKRVEEPPRPMIECDRERRAEDEDGRQCDRQQPGAVAFLSAPEAAGETRKGTDDAPVEVEVLAIEISRWCRFRWSVVRFGGSGGTRIRRHASVSWRLSVVKKKTGSGAMEDVFPQPTNGSASRVEIKSSRTAGQKRGASAFAVSAALST